MPKPDGAKRLLGIPNVVDRVIQLATAQVLMPIYKKRFSDNSYGFRSHCRVPNDMYGGVRGDE
ncbi:hypothetical protein ACAG39_11485 [Caldicellulosiruptoraceae bacterium PP1]